MRQFFVSLAAAILALLLGAIPAAAVEDIRSYDTAITVLRNGHADVTESITVNAEGASIQHGIFRDLGKTHSSTPAACNGPSRSFRSCVTARPFLSTSRIAGIASGSTWGRRTCC